MYVLFDNDGSVHRYKDSSLATGKIKPMDTDQDLTDIRLETTGITCTVSHCPRSANPAPLAADNLSLPRMPAHAPPPRGPRRVQEASQAGEDAEAHQVAQEEVHQARPRAAATHSCHAPVRCRGAMPWGGGAVASGPHVARERPAGCCGRPT